MKLKECVPLPLRRLVGSLKDAITKHLQSSPIDVVKANTKEAFEFFFAQDEFIFQHYLEPSRLALYELIADVCVGLLSRKDRSLTIRIADIGCGTGHMLVALRRKLEPEWKAEFFGLDFASTALEKARVLLPQARFFMQDIYSNRLPANSMDLVLCVETLEHLRHPEEAILHLLRLCKVQGDIVITVPNGEKDSWDGHVNFWDEEQFSELLSPHGLVETRLLQEDTTLLAHLVKRASGIGDGAKGE